MDPRPSASYARAGTAKVITSDRRGRGLANFGNVGGVAKGIDTIMREMDGDGDEVITVKEFARMMRKARSPRTGFHTTPFAW
jgi:hypothetical protein